MSLFDERQIRKRTKSIRRGQRRNCSCLYLAGELKGLLTLQPVHQQFHQQSIRLLLEKTIYRSSSFSLSLCPAVSLFLSRRRGTTRLLRLKCNVKWKRSAFVRSPLCLRASRRMINFMNCKLDTTGTRTNSAIYKIKVSFEITVARESTRTLVETFREQIICVVWNILKFHWHYDTRPSCSYMHNV